MNLLLLEAQDLRSPERALIRDERRLTHIRNVLKARNGSTLTVGLLNGSMGEGHIVQDNAQGIEIALSLNGQPPEPLPLTLVLALPRPQQLKRILQTVAGSGIKQLHLLHSRRVEKSYWQTPALKAEEIERQFTLGLEQAVDTVMPTVHFHQRFKPFVEDALPELMSDHLALVAHPYRAVPCPNQVRRPILLMVGPEGGFNDFEISLLEERGVQTVELGPRILKTETALPFLLGRITR